MSEQKRITLITLDYPPEQGGVARYLGNLVQASQGKIEVVVNEEHEITGPGSVRSVPFFWPFWPKWIPLVRFFRQLDRTTTQGTLISHVLPVGTAAWIASWFGGAPYCILLHGLDIRLALASPRRAWLLKRILKGAKRVLVNSTFVEQEVMTFLPSIKPIVVTPGVEALTFPPKEEARQRLSVEEGRYLILCVARLVPRKGLDTLISLLSDLPAHVQLVLVGDGADRERLQRLAEPVKERVHFISRATDEMRNQWYAAADVFVFLPREERTDVEGFGIVCLEAAAAGLPLIVGSTGGVPETVVPGKTGYVVQPTDQEKILMHLKELMQNPAQAQALGRAGRERVLCDFRWEDRWQQVSHTFYE